MGVQQEAPLASSTSLPLLSLNHVSFVCESVERSARFYQRVLGFALIKRPSSFDFQGAWLYNYGIGIHLIERSPALEPRMKPSVINPKANHVSFQCVDISLVKRRLEEMEVEYVTAVVVEGGVEVDQLFFHDPDGYMVEICDCQKLPVLPLSPAFPLRLPRVNSANRMPSPRSAQSLLGAMETRVDQMCSSTGMETKVLDELLLSGLIGITL